MYLPSPSPEETQEMQDYDQLLSQEDNERLREFNGRWWRWPDYEIISVLHQTPAYKPYSNDMVQRYIVPKIDNNSELDHYFPTIKGTRSPGIDKESIKRVTIDAIVRMHERLDNEDEILKFYREWGPLGILHNCANTIVNYPCLSGAKLERASEGDTPIGSIDNIPIKYSGVITAQNKIYMKERGRGWSTQYQDFPYTISAPTVKFQREARLNPPPIPISEGSLRSAYISLRPDPFSGIHTTYPINQGLREFFPLLSLTTSPCPEVNSDEFWKHYGENILMFKFIITKLVELVRLFEHIPNFGRIESDHEKAQKTHIYRKATLLLNQADDISQAGSLTEIGQHEIHLGFDSLLGIFAHSAKNKISSTWASTTCQAYDHKKKALCGNPYRPTREKSRYCSLDCKNRETSRKYRLRKKQGSVN